jgi:hypothetical protein
MHTFFLLMGLLAPTAAAASPFSDTPDWVSTLDPEWMQSTEGKVIASGDLKSLDRTLLAHGGVGSKMIDVGAMLTAAEEEFRAGARDAYSAGLLVAAPKLVDEYAEYDDRYVLHLSTEINVADSGLLYKYLPQLDGFYNPDVDGSLMTDAELGYAKDVLADPNAQLQAREDLQKALSAGDPQMLFEAMVDGNGVTRWTTETTVYKQGGGTHPDEVVDASEFLASKPFDTPLIAQPAVMEMLETPTELLLKGSAEQEGVVIVGWAAESNPETKWRVSFGFGYLRIGYGFVARAGIRLPYEVHTAMSPSEISGDSTDIAQINVTTDLDAIDGDSATYTDQGLPGWSGDELSLAAHVWMGVRLNAFNHDFIHLQFPDKDDRTQGGEATWGVDFSADFKSPLGDHAIGERFWIGYETSGAGVNYSLLGAGVDIGVNLEASSDRFEYDWRLVNLSDGGIRDDFRIRAFGPGSRSDWYWQHNLPSDAFAFGYELDRPSVRLDMSATPGIRMRAQAKLSNISSWFSDRTVTTSWLEPITFELGSVDLGPIEGTDGAIDGVLGFRTVD